MYVHTYLVTCISKIETIHMQNKNAFYASLSKVHARALKNALSNKMSVFRVVMFVAIYSYVFIAMLMCNYACMYTSL